MSSSIRQYPSQNLRNYPKIHIERGNVIKPCNVNQNAADQFIDKSQSTWKKILRDAWSEGILFLLRYLSTLKSPENANAYYSYVVKAIRYFAILLLHVHRIYLYIYSYFYPCSLMPLDDVCDQFSRCPKWSESVIRAFAWHPNHDRCAIAICNDYIYVYESSNRIRVLRHAQQRKITDLAWQPNKKDVLVVATQMHIILWRVTDHHSGTLSYIKDNSRNGAYLAPGVQLISRVRDSSQHQNLTNGSIKHVDISTTATAKNNETDFKLLLNVLAPPITSIQFDQTGHKLFACSPNSSRIAILDISLLFNNDCAVQSLEQGKPIEYLTRYGLGVTKLMWSPKKDRLAAATTSSKLRVYEPFKWTYNNWSLQGNYVQDMIWSKPKGRMLLIANKTEPVLYALPFLDDSQASDVGGNKSLMKALDLTATRTETGDMVGGIVQSLAWDKHGKRLAISFKENPESILLYRTEEKPTIEFHQLGIIQSDNNSFPLFMEFHDNYKNGSLLTICWSDGNCQHIPMTYSPSDQFRNGNVNDDSLNRSYYNSSMNNASQQATDINSPPKTPRSLTNFCLVSGNNSITSYSASLVPLNKIQHQTTLFSLSKQPNEDSSKDSSNEDFNLTQQ